MTEQRRPSGYTPPADWQNVRRRVIARDHGVCYLCGRPGATSVDHIQPVAEGGTHDPGNLAAVHPEPCHARKTEQERRRALARRARRRPARPNPNVVDDAGKGGGYLPAGRAHS